MDSKLKLYMEACEAIVVPAYNFFIADAGLSFDDFFPMLLRIPD